MLEILGLKNPFPKMMIPNATYNNILANSRSEPNILALKNNNN